MCDCHSYFGNIFDLDSGPRNKVDYLELDFIMWAGLKRQIGTRLRLFGNAGIRRDHLE